ncbi:Leucyl/phenylalanyl-tRNA--protein transferase [Pontiella desulfatans]|uniref:Leucyl/phenylalanyl-tRNA--protein transferase n=1 Tax=Pontiella desulfatans TaxID=2750659 RepID=A0A6C2U9E8_PONDE|nr:leucyl/phenylalanyl-tRNA--protein transferase [Pontiella desulfatans]VGO16006.1 Leucyl/phenylalanyl-tRNA--protein transferase [Pontiella desulfatans]
MLSRFYDAQVWCQSKLFPPPPKGAFPPIWLTTRKPPYGLLARGGELTEESLLLAYSKGVFPFTDRGSVNWWSCDPRMVLFPEKMKFNRRFRQQLRSDRFSVTFDTAFEQVVNACAERESTWLNPERIAICNALHEKGYSHSVEVWSQEGLLVGGVFGTDMGKILIGESSFHREPSASKIAIVTLACHLQHWGYHAFDIGGYQAYCEAMGFENIPRKEYLAWLKKGTTDGRKTGKWRVDPGVDVAAWKPGEPGSQVARRDDI